MVNKQHVSRIQDAVIITVLESDISVRYASYVKPFWTAVGVNARTFPAFTPDTMPDTMRFENILMQKYASKGFTKPHTPTEKATWYSHIAVWRECIQAQRPYLVLEHDAIPTRPSSMCWDTSVDFQSFDLGAMGCYVITPKFATQLIHWLRFTHGVIDSGPGSLLWWIKEDKLLPADLIIPGDARYVPAATQVIDRRYGTVIDHYTGTEAEKYEWHDFPHYKEITLP